MERGCYLVVIMREASLAPLFFAALVVFFFASVTKFKYSWQDLHWLMSWELAVSTHSPSTVSALQISVTLISLLPEMESCIPENETQRKFHWSFFPKSCINRILAGLRQESLRKNSEFLAVYCSPSLNTKIVRAISDKKQFFWCPCVPGLSEMAKIRAQDE